MSDCCGPAGTAHDSSLELLEVQGSGPGPGAETVWFEGGRSQIGTNAPEIAADGEGPRRTVRLKPFGLERHAVSNARFAEFVAATGYVTEAERFGWSFVFAGLLPPAEAAAAQRVAEVPWWARSDGASWRHPEGPNSDIGDRPDHPVTHVSWNDARAYASWRGGRLPTEAEWEHAARPTPDAVFPWGDEEPTDERPLCNIWQGRFPDHNLAVDGYAGTAPVGSFSPNAFGMLNMAGNVWEWCEDRFRVKSLAKAAKQRDAQAVAAGERVLKGGSYLCHRSYCYRYRIAARMGRPADTSTGHTGFRIAFDR
jgi:formylglycine-generating enzyme